VVLHVLRSRDLAGELGFLDGQKHTATLRSIGPTELISLERDSLENLLATHPRVVYQVMRAVIRSVHSTLRRMNIQYVEMSNYINKQHGRY
jgi:CRP-like cAMP-binding protein